MPERILLPRYDGELSSYVPGSHPPVVPPEGRLESRVAYAAAHVVCNPLADNNPIVDADLDWDATLAYRRYLWSLGLSVAEAMDTAQHGMGLGWETSRELICRSLAEARAEGGAIACGAGTDHLEPSEGITLQDVKSAYEEQCVRSKGGTCFLAPAPIFSVRPCE